MAASTLKPTRTLPARLKMQTPRVCRPEPGTQETAPAIGTPATYRWHWGPTTLVVTPMALFEKKLTMELDRCGSMRPMTLFRPKVMNASGESFIQYTSDAA